MAPHPTIAPNRTRELTTATLVLALCGWGCSALQTPPPSPVPCLRVPLEPAPPWTASAAWDRNEEELLLVDPGRHSLVVYGRDGRRRHQVALDPVAELNYAVPMRLERTAGGYVLIDQTQVLRFDDGLALRSRQRPLAGLAAQGFNDASLNDVLLHEGVLYGYADFVDTHHKPADDPDASGTWRRGFVRLDPERARLDLLRELPIDATGEYAAYYLYDRRPYVSELGGRIYLLRFTIPWTVHRVTRQGLRQVASGAAGDEEQARSLHAWNGRLYVLTSRLVPDEDAPQEPTVPVPRPQLDERVRVELLQADAVAAGKRQWTLREIDRRSGRERRRLRLPTAAERIRLVPGRAFWTAIEETASPNLGQGEGSTSFLFLPATEIVAGTFRCGAEPAPSSADR